MVGQHANRRFVHRIQVRDFTMIHPNTRRGFSVQFRALLLPFQRGIRAAMILLKQRLEQQEKTSPV